MIKNEVFIKGGGLVLAEHNRGHTRIHRWTGHSAIQLRGHALGKGGLTIVECNDFDMGDGGVGNWKFDPFVARDAGTGGEGHEIVVALGVAGGAKGNRTHGSGARCVGGFGVLKHLHVGAKLEAHGVVVGLADACDDDGWAHAGNAILMGKSVETADGVRDHVSDHGLR